VYCSLFSMLLSFFLAMCPGERCTAEGDEIGPELGIVEASEGWDEWMDEAEVGWLCEPVAYEISRKSHTSHRHAHIYV
jgi:hypothetical protein